MRLFLRRVSTKRYRLWLPLGIVLFLGACASGIEPLAVGDRPGRTFVPDDQPIKAVIIAVHGFNDHSTAFVEFGELAADSGYLLDAYDHQGFGQNANWSYWPGKELLVADLIERIDEHKRQTPQLPVFLLGESMGAAISILASKRIADNKIDGLIMSAPAVWGGDAMNPFYRGALWMLAKIAPNWTLTGRGLGVQASDNIPMLQALSADPLYIKETRVQSIQGLVELMGDARQTGPLLRLPRLLLDGRKDEIVVPDVLDSFAAQLTEPTCRRITYAEGWHLLLRDLQRQRVFDDILTWLDDPSGSGIGRACSSER